MFTNQSKALDATVEKSQTTRPALYSVVEILQPGCTLERKMKGLSVGEMNVWIGGIHILKRMDLYAKAERRRTSSDGTI